MKRISNYLLAITFSFALLGCKSAKKIEELDSKDNLYYVKGTQDLYSGEIADSYGNNQKKYEGEVKDGKITGTYREYYESGNRKAERVFENGIEKEGSIEWLENGSEKLTDNDAIKILKEEVEILEGNFRFGEKAEFTAVGGVYYDQKVNEIRNYQKNLESMGIINASLGNGVRGYAGSWEFVKFPYSAQLTPEAQNLVLKKNDIGSYEVNCGEYKFDELIGVFQNEPKVAEVEYFTKFYASLFFRPVSELDYFGAFTDHGAIHDGARFKRKVTIRKYEGKGWKISE